MKWKELTIDIIAALYILLFLYAALTKLTDYEKFRVQLGQSPLLTSIAGFVAWFIPAVEILLATMLTFTRTRLLAMYGSFTLMVMFTAYIVAILNFSDFIPCNCGGLLQSMQWSEHLVFNIVFAGLAASAILMTPNTEKSDNAIAIQ